MTSSLLKWDIIGKKIMSKNFCVLIAFILFVCGCNRTQSTSDIFLKDNGAIDYSRWDGWVVSARQNYYIVQYTQEDSLREQLIFWNSCPFAVRLVDPNEKSCALTLSELASDQAWKRNYHFIKYQDLYSIIQLVSKYSVLKISVRNDEVFIAGKDFKLHKNKDGTWEE